MSNFKKVIEERRKAASAQPPEPKDPSQMSEAELDREYERLEGELRSFKEQAVRAAREERTAITTPRKTFLNTRSRRRLWK